MKTNNDGGDFVSYPVVLLGILIIGLILIFGVSFAFQGSADNNNAQIGVLEIMLNDNDKGIVIENMIPMIDEDGKKLESYQFKVKNTGKINGTYKLLIEDLPLGLIDDGCTTNTLLKRNQLQYQLVLNGQEIAFDELSGVKTNVLYIGEVNSNTEQFFQLRMWVPIQAGLSDWKNKHYHFKITIQPINKEGVI